MNSFVEIAVIAVLVAAALAFVVRRLVKTIKGKQPSCCSGASGSGTQASCPHCSGCSSGHK